MINERWKFSSAIDEAGKQKYQRLRYEIIRKSNRDKEEVYLNDKFDEINSEFKINNLDKASGMIKRFLTK